MAVILNGRSEDLRKLIIEGEVFLDLLADVEGMFYIHVLQHGYKDCEELVRIVVNGHLTYRDVQTILDAIGNNMNWFSIVITDESSVKTEGYKIKVPDYNHSFSLVKGVYIYAPNLPSSWRESSYIIFE